MVIDKTDYNQFENTTREIRDRDAIRNIDTLQDRVKQQDKSILQYQELSKGLSDRISILEKELAEKKGLLEFQKEAMECQRDTIAAQKERIKHLEQNLRLIVEEDT